MGSHEEKKAAICQKNRVVNSRVNRRQAIMFRTVKWECATDVPKGEKKASEGAKSHQKSTENAGHSLVSEQRNQKSRARKDNTVALKAERASNKWTCERAPLDRFGGRTGVTGDKKSEVTRSW